MQKKSDPHTCPECANLGGADAPFQGNEEGGDKEAGSLSATA